MERIRLDDPRLEFRGMSGYIGIEFKYERSNVPTSRDVIFKMSNHQNKEVWTSVLGDHLRNNKRSIDVFFRTELRPIDFINSWKESYKLKVYRFSKLSTAIKWVEEFN